VKLPPWGAKEANLILAKMFSREVDAELAKLDYITMTLLVAHGAESKTALDAKIDALQKFRKVTHEVLNGDAFSPIILSKRLKEREEEKKREAAMLVRVAALSGD